MSMVFDTATRAVLAERLRTETEKVRMEFGDAAFVVTRAATAYHEGGHGIQVHVEGVTVTSVQIYDEPVPSKSALGVVDGFRHGVFLSRGRSDRVDAHTDPVSDLSEARIVLAGRMGELMCEHGRWGCALDELVLARAITDTAARKLNVDAEKLWRAEVRGKVRKILRLNQGVVDTIAARLIADGFIRGRRLKEILEGVRRLDGDRP